MYVMPHSFCRGPDKEAGLVRLQSDDTVCVKCIEFFVMSIDNDVQEFMLLIIQWYTWGMGDSPFNCLAIVRE